MNKSNMNKSNVSAILFFFFFTFSRMKYVVVAK